MRVVEQEPKGTERGTAGTGEFLRYTPSAYVEASREVALLDRLEGILDETPAFFRDSLLPGEKCTLRTFLSPWVPSISIRRLMRKHNRR